MPAVDVSLREYIEALMAARDRHLDERLRSMEAVLRELSEQLRDYGTLLPRKEYAAAHAALEMRFEEINNKIRMLEGRSAGINSMTSFVFIVMGLAISLGLGVLHLMKG